MMKNKNCNKRHETQGGGVAAPVGGQIFSEILPYLEVNQENPNEVEVPEKVKVPNLIGLSIKEAEKIVKELGLEIDMEGDKQKLDEEKTKIKDQTPTEGIIVNKGNKIFVK